MAKPSEYPVWATDASADVVEPPDAKKVIGFIKEKPPHEWFNWFMELVHDWTVHHDDYEQNHLHDGGSSDLSAPLVNFSSHIDWDEGGGAGAKMSVTTDDGTTHEVTHDGGTATSKFVSDIIEAASRLVADTVRSATGTDIDFQDAAGTSQAATLLADTIKLATAVETSSLKASTLDSNLDGTGYTLQIGTVFLDSLQSSSADDVIKAWDNALSGVAAIDAKNTPIAWGHITEDGSGNYFFANDYGLTNIQKQATAGEVQIDLDGPRTLASAADGCVIATVEGSGALYASAQVIDTNTIQVNIYDDTGANVEATNEGFFVVVYG